MDCFSYLKELKERIETSIKFTQDKFIEFFTEEGKDKMKELINEVVAFRQAEVAIMSKGAGKGKDDPM